MNTGRIEDEKKAKADNIQKQMRQKWVPKSTKNVRPNNDDQVTQELGDSTISTQVIKENQNQANKEDIEISSS